VGGAGGVQDNETQKTGALSLIEHIDAAGKNQNLLQNSRKKLLGIADDIIPGHGKTFPAPH
jgi:hypothetical protein